MVFINKRLHTIRREQELSYYWQIIAFLVLLIQLSDMCQDGVRQDNHLLHCEIQCGYEARSSCEYHSHPDLSRSKIFQSNETSKKEISQSNTYIRLMHT